MEQKAKGFAVVIMIVFVIWDFIGWYKDKNCNTQ